MDNLTNNSKVLMKNNILVKAKYNISTIENRIFQMVLYKLQRKNEDVLTCEISHSEFKNFIKNPNQCTVNAICNTLINIRKSSIFFEDNHSWMEFGFINGHEYDKKTCIFKIQVSDKVYSLLKKYLATGYTPINLQIFLGFKNYYAQRFYELLRLWSGVKTKINYTINEIKEYLMLNHNYTEYGNLKRRVIIPAIKELNNTGFFEIEFNEIKEGRRVVSIDFIVKDLDKRIYFKEIESLDDIEISKENIIDIDDTRIEPLEKINKKGIEKILHIENKSIIKMINSKVKNYGLSKYEDLIWDAEIATLEKDNNKYDGINGNNYKYFITTLLNKLELVNLDNIKEFCSE